MPVETSPVSIGDDLIIGSDNPVELDRLKDRWSTGYIDTATVVATLKSGSFTGTTIATVTLAAVGSGGRYRSVWEENLGYTNGAPYYEEITASASGGRVQKFRSIRTARY